MRKDGLARPTLFGTGAAIVFAALWYGLRAWSGSALDLLVFCAAFALALTVRRSTTRRSLGTGLLAASLTYVSASLAFVPLLAATLEHDVLEAEGRDGTSARPGVIAYGVAVPLSCVSPVVLAAESPSESGPALLATAFACLGAGAFAARKKRETGVDPRA